MAKKLLFVFNPRSGKAQVKNYIFDITDIFTKGGYDVTVRPTQGPDDAYNSIKKKAAEYDVIVVSGGDGTLNEAVRALMSFSIDERKPLGYIPAGTTNDFASSRGISADILEAANQIVEGNTFQCDIGLFNDKYFTYVAAFGAFTDISYDTPQEIKNILGHAAYLLEGLKKLTNLQSFHIKLRSGDTEIDDYFFLGLILNSTRIAGFNIKHLESETRIDLSDGIFEIVLIKKPVTFMQLQEILMSMLMGGIQENEQFCLIRTSSVHISSDEEIKWTFDGEFGGAYSEVQMDVLNKAMTFMG